MHEAWRILLDLDGTILVNAGPDVAQEDFGVNMQGVSDHRGIMGRLNQERNLSDEAFWDWWRVRESLIYSRGIVLPKAVGTLQRLSDGGAFIQIVTARGESGAEATLHWLAEHGVPYNGIQFNNWNGKVAAAQEYGLNLAFEDEPRFAEGLRGLMPVIMVDAPVNQGVTSGDGIYKIKSWSEVPRLLKRIGRNESAA